MEITEKLENLKRLKKELRSKRKELSDASSDLFDSWCKDFFTKNSDVVKSFAWNQYTPYFNDGDTCVFSANTDYIKVNGEYCDELDNIQKIKVTNWGTWNRETKTYDNRVQMENPNYDERLDNLVTEIKDFLQLFDDDFYLQKYGDHTEITVTKNGIDVDEFDHD
jgi:hypothetical protein